MTASHDHSCYSQVGNPACKGRSSSARWRHSHSNEPQICCLAKKGKFNNTHARMQRLASKQSAAIRESLFRRVFFLRLALVRFTFDFLRVQRSRHDALDRSDPGLLLLLVLAAQQVFPAERQAEVLARQQVARRKIRNAKLCGDGRARGQQFAKTTSRCGTLLEKSDGALGSANGNFFLFFLSV